MQADADAEISWAGTATINIQIFNQQFIKNIMIWLDNILSPDQRNVVKQYNRPVT